MAQRTAESIALGRAVRSLRSTQKLTQEELALAAGLQRKTVSELEGGLTDPRVRTLRSIAAACDVHIAEIFVRADEFEAEGREE